MAASARERAAPPQKRAITQPGVLALPDAAGGAGGAPAGLGWGVPQRAQKRA